MVTYTVVMVTYTVVMATYTVVMATPPSLPPPVFMVTHTHIHLLSWVHATPSLVPPPPPHFLPPSLRFQCPNIHLPLFRRWRLPQSHPRDNQTCLSSESPWGVHLARSHSSSGVSTSRTPWLREDPLSTRHCWGELGNWCFYLPLLGLSCEWTSSLSKWPLRVLWNWAAAQTASHIFGFT